MSYNSQIGICTLRHFFLQFYLELTVVVFFDFPCCTIVFKMFLKDRPKVLFFSDDIHLSSKRHIIIRSEKEQATATVLQ